MSTPLTTYWDVGRKAAEARNEDDEPTALTLSEQFRKEQAKEPEPRRRAVNDAYHRAFRLYRKI